MPILHERDCDEVALACDGESQIVGCPADQGQTCEDVKNGLESEQLDTWLTLVNTKLNSLCADKERLCVCKPGFYRETADPLAQCVPYNKCFGGCPQHSVYTEEMPWCAPSCDDPDGLQCLSDANEAIDNFEQVKGSVLNL